MNIRQNCAYTGIGSRETPDEILEWMRELAAELADTGWTLRSGGASGSDRAFEEGCDTVNGKKEIFLPWKRFNQNPSPLFTIPKEAFDIAAEHHPAWFANSLMAKKFHARNVQQVLGENLDTPTKVVVCWTPDGAEKQTSSKTGGTGQAIRVAVSNNIPVFNLYNEGRLEELKGALDDILLQYSDYFD